MKRIMKILSVALACAMLICAIPFSAATAPYTEDDLNELMITAEHSFLGSFENNTYYSGATLRNVEAKIADAKSYFRLSQNLRTDELLQTCYINLNNSMTTDTVVSQKTIEIAYNYTKDETNDDGYFSKDTWDEYVLWRTNVKNALHKGVQEAEANELFYGYRAAYNNLIKTNVVAGDADRDGKLTIADITLMQKQLAGIGNFATSQVLAIKASNSYSEILFSIYDTTMWLKSLAKIEDCSAKHLDSIANNDYNFIFDDKAFIYMVSIQH